MNGLRIVTFGPHRRLPRPMRGRAWLLVAGALLVGLVLLPVLVHTVRAEEEPERYTPSSRGNRAVVLERSEVVDLASEVFGPDLAHYVANIAWCESNHRPAARSAGWDRLYGWYSYVGLMQVEQGIWGPVALRLFGSDDLTDPWINLSVARVIQRQQGWRAWPVCSR